MSIGSFNKFSLFFCKNCGFIVKKLYNVFYSKYCPSLTIIFSHLSGSIRILRRKKLAFFEAIHESIHFLVSLYEENFCSNRPCIIDRNKWQLNGAISGKYGGWDRTSNFSVFKYVLTVCATRSRILSYWRIILSYLCSYCYHFSFNSQHKLKSIPIF